MSHLSISQILVIIVVLAAAVTDLRSRRIPNWLTLSGCCAGLLLNCFSAGAAGLKTSVCGLLLGFGLYFVLYCLRAMGAGDVKLMAAVGAIVGPGNWMLVFMASAIAGGVLALVLMVWSGRVRETLWNTFFVAQELAHLRAPYTRQKHLDVKHPGALNMPHGVAIAAGTMACLLFAGLPR
jgi:prepilin peptidase CpaA